MSFVKTPEQLEKMHHIIGNSEYRQMQMVVVPFETTEEFIRSILPPPLEFHEPVGYAFIYSFATSNCLGPFSGGGVYLSCRYKEDPGNYCLTLPIDTEVSKDLGRDCYGEPKKNARIFLEKKEQDIAGWTERYGIRYMELQARMEEELPPGDPSMRIIYQFKYSHKASGERGFDLNPVLIRHESHRSLTRLQSGSGQVTFRESPYDPVHLVPLLSMGQASYIEGKIVTKARKVADVDPEAFYSYSFSPAKHDPWPLLDGLYQLPGL